MKNQISHIAAILILMGIISLSSCESENVSPENEIKSIKYGTSFGECIGYCQRTMEILPDSISLKLINSRMTVEAYYPDLFCGKGFSETEFHDLIELVNVNSFQSLPAKIGCPDCADGGAEWIEIIFEDSSHKVTFEYMKEPEAIREFVKELRNLFDSLNDCM